ncbi:MAG: hypothetical protein NTV51_00090 [Verrucomicrobia bacterium]|nr:hypothetical protein [Verrucomicrobiota bacterium]
MTFCAATLVIQNAILVLVFLFLFRKERARRAELEAWIKANLDIIYYECGFMSPQVAKTIAVLIAARENLGTVDATGLRRELARLRREHDAVVIQQTEHWASVRAQIAAEAAQGAPLPGLDAKGGAS